METETATFGIRAEAAPLAKALALALACVDRRNTVAAIGGALLVANDAGLTITTTNLDSAIAVRLACDVEEQGAALVPARELADAVKKLAKQRDAIVELTLDGERLAIGSGRSRFSLPTIERGDFPDGITAWDAQETQTMTADAVAGFQCDGRALGADAAKAMAKVAKYVGADQPVAVDYRQPEDATWRIRATFAAVTFVAGLHEPDLYRSAPRSRFEYGCDDAAHREALSYLRTLRGAHGLPLVDDSEPRLITHEGRAVGLQVGEGSRDYAEWRDMPADWSPPADAEIEFAGCQSSCEIDGVRYGRLGDKVWQFHHVPEVVGAIVYPVGAYSLPMPADQRRAVSAISVTVDGVDQPLRAMIYGSGETGAIELTAAQVAELCGPVDPSTFVPIAPLASHHGRIINREGLFVPPHAPTIKEGRKTRKMTDGEQLRAYCADPRGWMESIAARFNGQPLVGDVSAIIGDGAPVDDVPAVVQAPAADPVEPVEPVEPEPIAATPEPIAKRENCHYHAGLKAKADCQPRALPSYFTKSTGPNARDWLRGWDDGETPPNTYESRTVGGLFYQVTRGGFGTTVWHLPPDRGGYATPAVVIAEPAHGRDDAELDRIIAAHAQEAAPDPVDAMPEPIAAPVAPAEPAAIPAAPDDVRERLARLEAALGLGQPPKRTARHAAAIQRAWDMRRAKRERAELDRAALLQVNGYNRIVREENERLRKALDHAEGFVAERAELVAEIDRLRATLERESDGLERNGREALRLSKARGRIVKRALAMRRDVARTRAERDGIAGNVAALTSRIAADAATIDALRNGAGPVQGEPRRFILSTRLEA